MGRDEWVRGGFFFSAWYLDSIYPGIAFVDMDLYVRAEREKGESKHEHVRYQGSCLLRLVGLWNHGVEIQQPTCIHMGIMRRRPG